MTDTKEHHPFCNYYMNPREGCKYCERLDRDGYEQKEGESVADMIERYFPNARVVR